MTVTGPALSTVAAMVVVAETFGGFGMSAGFWISQLGTMSSSLMSEWVSMFSPPLSQELSTTT